MRLRLAGLVISIACALSCDGRIAGCAGESSETSALRVFRDARIGQRLRVPDEPGLECIVAAGPLGPTRAELRALDADGKALARSTTGGPQGLPRLALPQGTRFVVLHAREPSSARGALRIYVNDARDDDGDGVGPLLEQALGTCDRADDPGCAHSALAAFYASSKRATRDSDRDGLSDGDELWGVAKQPRLDLPRYGVDPAHKDVLLEIDRSKGVEAPGLSAEDLAQIASLFEAGSAAALRNPDREPGIRVHFDIGAEEATPQGLFGDWGGSGQSATDYKKARRSDFTQARAGYFRYAVLVRSGFGQSSGDALVANRDYNRVALLAHELAHTLGLKHEGTRAWGAVNCKPNHFSIINYAYQNFPEVGFSTYTPRALGALGELDATRVLERAPIDARLAERLRLPPFELDASEAGVDWNRDGQLSDAPVRAALTWATYKSCESASFGRITLAEQPLPATPVLVASAQRTHVFYLDEAGQLMHRAATERACDAGDPLRCTQLGTPHPAAAVLGAHHIASLLVDPQHAAIAVVARDRRLELITLGLDGAPRPSSGYRAVADAQTESAPAMAFIDVSAERYGQPRVLAVMYRDIDAAGTLMQASSLGPSSPFIVRPVLDEALQPITSPLAPALVTLPSGETCGAFADAERFIRFYCYVKERDVWRDVSQRAFYAGLGPQTGGPVGLAYHRYRNADGSPLDPDHARGAIYLSFTEPAPEKNARPDNPALLISEWLDLDHPATDAIAFRWRGNVLNQWTHLAAGTTFSLYEDEATAHMKGVLTRHTKEGLIVELLPMVDGALPGVLRGGDDFEVMERGVCTGIRGEAACGGPQTGSY